MSVGNIMRDRDSLSWYCSGPFHLRCRVHSPMQSQRLPSRLLVRACQ